MKLLIRQEPATNNPSNTFFRPLKPSILKALRRTLQATSRIISVATGAELSLLLCGDEFIRDLNQQYRGKDAPTDVLSFAQEGPVMLGDIVISVETAARQADGAGWSLDSELALLASHGLLHLAGCDDETEEGAAEMEKLSRMALQRAEIDLPTGSHPFFTRLTPLDSSLPLPTREG